VAPFSLFPGPIGREDVCGGTSEELRLVGRRLSDSEGVAIVVVAAEAASERRSRMAGAG
jgi:hypothetical protein